MAQRGEGVTKEDSRGDTPKAAGRTGGPATLLAPVLERRLAWARAAVFWERLWPALMPAAYLAGLLLILAGFDIWRFTPVWLHWLLLVGFAGGIIALLWLELRHLRWPDRAAAMRRLERVNLLQHRPLEAAADSLPAEQHDPIAQAIWDLHRRRALAQLATVRVGTPEAGWWRRDTWGLRAALGLLLVVAWASPGEDRGQRLADTLNPGSAIPHGTQIAVEAWITPPAYTGRAPVFLTRDGKAVQQPPGSAALNIPTGSLLKLRLAAAPAGFSIKFGAKEEALHQIDERNGEIDLALDLAQGEHPSLQLLRRDKVFAEWPLRVVPDTAPQIRYSDDPKTMRRIELEVAFDAEDDYAVQQVKLELTREGAESPVSVDWPVPLPGGSRIADKQSFDFTAHPWAGLAVQMTLVAADALGQTGRSDTVSVTLPARRFNHPVAKAIVEQRRELALKPAQWQRVVTALRALSLAPERYRDDATAHLGLRMSAARLGLNRSAASIAAVQDLLWQTALHIEDGRSSQSERDFQALMDKLQDAIDRNADDQEIQKLMQELRQAMDQMLEQMMRDAMERLARGEEPEELGEDEEAMSSEDMQDMMDRAQDMAQMGDRQSAKDMLEQMQRMMEAMKNGRIARMPEGRQQGQRGQRGQRGQGQMGQMMQEFGEMLRQQQQLLDRSFRRSQQGQRGDGNQRGENEADARAQDELRRRLGEMMGRLGERNGGQLPDQLGKAERSMRDAREALRRGEPGEAMQGQTDALDQLRQGLNQMQQAQRGNPDGQAAAADSRQNQRNPIRDPLGRNMTGYENAGEATKVPDLAPVERARRILEELQRRAGNRERNQQELDYLDRLLRRF